MGKLPVKLNKEPLLDATFEIRFTSSVLVSNIVPGILYSKLDGEKSIERLGAAEIPKAIRDTDPSLLFSPLLRLSWDKFLISIGDSNLQIACKLPYPGWSDFKPAIRKVLLLIKESEILDSVLRCSMKYTDLIPAQSVEEQISQINGQVDVGGHVLKNESFSIKFERHVDNMINVVNIITDASIKLSNGDQKNGLIIDVDTILNAEISDVDHWFSQLSNNLDSLHHINKNMFFNCLKQDAIKSLEPEYE